jgi:hypothetical protein
MANSIWGRPVDAAVGVEPHGKLKISRYCTARIGIGDCVQLNIFIVVDVRLVKIIEVGFAHVGGGAQVAWLSS